MILTSGEALIDVFVAPGEGLRRDAVFAIGGSPCNVAVALARQGTSASFFGGLSSDSFGDMLRGILDHEGVDHRLSPRLPNKTTLSIVSRDASGNPSYDFRGIDGADIMVTTAHVPTALPPDIQAVALSSYPLVVEPVCHAMLALARLAACDRVVSIDVNYRAALVGSASRWAARFAGYEPLATIMKASEEDVALAYEGQKSPEAAAQHWLASGASLVLITQGPQGAMAYTQGQTISMDAPDVTLADSVGAGDCFHAGFLAALTQRDALSRQAIAALSADTIRDCLAWAVVTASLNVARQGTDPPTRNEIRSALIRHRMGLIT